MIAQELSRSDGGSPPEAPRLHDGVAPEAAAFALAPRVLIVEDNWLAAIELEAALEEGGYAVVGIAVSADEAVQVCQTERPALVLMDIRLLGPRDGVDAAIEIRRRFGIGSVFVSAHDDPDVRARATAAQPLGWVAKPVTSALLLKALAELAGNRGG